MGAELLFFDTFSHDLAEDLNLDLVQFPNPVIVEEVRVIPLGARVQANFPGGVRLGATNPAQFQLEFFVNDLSKPGTSTFEALGVLPYDHDGKIHLGTDKKIPTDGLVLKGYYNAITLAVYGTLSESTAEQLAIQAANNAQTAAPDGDAQRHCNSQASPAPAGVAGCPVSSPPAALTNNITKYNYSTPPTPSQPVSEAPRTPSDVKPVQNSAPHENDTSSNHYDNNSNSNMESSRVSFRDRHKEQQQQQPQQQRRRRRRSSKEWPVNGRSREGSSDRASNSNRRSKERSRSPLPEDHRATTTTTAAAAATPRSSRSPALSHSSGELGYRPVSRSPPPPLSSSSSSLNHNNQQPVALQDADMLDLNDMSDISDGDIPDVAKDLDDDADDDDDDDDDDEEDDDDNDDDDEEEVNLDGAVGDKADAAVSCAAETDSGNEMSNVVSGSRKGRHYEQPIAPSDAKMEPKQTMLKEDIEEISDEEAEWSDEGDCVLPADFLVPDDLTQQLELAGLVPKTFDILSEIQPLVYFGADVSCVAYSAGPDLVSKIQVLHSLSGNAACAEFVDLVEQITAQLNDGHGTFCELEQPLRAHLTEAVLLSLKVELALKQPLPTYKVRHLKSGLKFCSVMLHDKPVNLRKELLHAGLMPLLIDLFSTPHMVVSLKLLILRNLDLCTSESLGLTEAVNLYKKLVWWMAGAKQSTRVKYAISALLSKLHLDEVLERLSGLCLCAAADHRSAQDSDLLSCLDHIMSCYHDAILSLAQPTVRFLPTSSRFQLDDGQALFQEHSRAFFQLWHRHSTLRCLSKLLTQSGVIGCRTRRLLCLLLRDKSGLVHLLSYPQLAMQMAKDLLSGHWAKFGSSMALCLHAFSAVDRLYALCSGISDRKQLETMPILTTIQNLHALTFPVAGRFAVIQTLAHGRLLDVILRLVQHSSNADSESGDMVKRDMKRSAIRAYASEILLLIVRGSEDVGYLRHFAKLLRSIASEDEASRLYELTAWLSPLADDKMFSLEGISDLCDIVKRNVDKLSPLSLELVTAVRLLQHHCAVDRQSGHVKEQRPKFAMIGMLSNDLLDQYLTILTKITSYHEQPHLHAATFAGQNGFLLLSVVKPMVRTLGWIVPRLITLRQGDFKDVSLVPVLLKTYSMCSVAANPSAVGFMISQEVRRDVIRLLLAYLSLAPNCQPSSKSASLWQLMIKEVLSYAICVPHAFAQGLIILTKLLPQPLPIRSRRPLSQEEVRHAEMIRNLWSAHLFHQEPEIRAVLMTTCVQVSLQRTFCQMCYQLADLSAPMAMLVIRTVIDSLKMSVKSRVAADESAAPDCQQLLAPILSALHHLLKSPSLKAAFLTLETDSREYADLPQTLVGLLSSHPVIVAGILGRLMDPAICLLPSNPSAVSHMSDAVLANSLPVKEHFLLYLGSVLDQLQAEPCTSPKHKDHPSRKELMPLLAILTATAQHHFGLHHLKVALSRSRRTLLYDVLQWSVLHQPDVLSSVCQLLKSLLRTSSSAAVAEMLQWKEDASTSHPLRQVNDQDLLRLLGSPPDANASDNFMTDEEPCLPSPDPLLIQFSRRPFFTVTSEQNGQKNQHQGAADADADQHDDDEEEYGRDVDLVKVDLIELTDSLAFPDFNLITELRGVCDEKSVEMEKRKKITTTTNTTKKSLLEMKALHNKNLISNFKAGGAVLTGRAGRGFNRVGQRSDAFRSRPPNTSRPPSLHVDDFLVLESRGQQPTGPTGYNKQSLKAAQELFAQREAKKGTIGYREATKEPIFSTSSGGGNGSSSTASGGGNGCSNLNSMSSPSGTCITGNGSAVSELSRNLPLADRVGRAGRPAAPQIKSTSYRPGRLSSNASTGSGNANSTGALSGTFNRDRLSWLASSCSSAASSSPSPSSALPSQSRVDYGRLATDRRFASSSSSSAARKSQGERRGRDERHASSTSASSKPRM